jgi:hypothetical protein
MLSLVATFEAEEYMLTTEKLLSYGTDFHFYVLLLKPLDIV